MTGFGTVEAAVEAVKAGAYDFLTKPFEDISVVELAVRQAAERKRLRVRNERLEAELAARDRFEGLVGSAPARCSRSTSSSTPWPTPTPAS